MIVEITGLNLEKLLREAQDAGLALRDVRRMADRRILAGIMSWERAALFELCARFGWEVREVRAGLGERAARFLKRRWALALGTALCLALVALFDGMILYVDVVGAQEYNAEVRRFLAEEGVTPGRMKRAFSLDALREALLLRLPGVSHASVRYAGSVLEVDCRLAREGETLQKAGNAPDLVAAQAGVVTRLVVSSGTPVVAVGEAVYAGQVLVRGEERTQKGETMPVRAEAQVYARVWAQGEAKAGLFQETSRDTGRTRTRVTLKTPWHTRVLRDATPFDAQEVSVAIEPVIDLFIPLWRRSEMYHEIEILREPCDQADAASQAQGAAENLAKKQLPAGVLILDKWVDYSMIDNEFVYASVVLEYEQDIAIRADGL